MKRKKKQKKATGYFIAGFLILVFVVLGFGLYSQNEREKPPTAIALTIAQERIYNQALAEYLCPCGACDEVFYTCECPTALEVKKDTRRRLQEENATYKDIAWLLEHVYEAKKKV
jgi:hypothetical protein